CDAPSRRVRLATWSRASRTLSRTVSHGRSVAAWNTTPRSVPGPSTSRPAITTPPVVGVLSPIRIDSTVDLPQPEWPSSQPNSPSATSSVKSRRITAGPDGVSYVLASCAISTNAGGSMCLRPLAPTRAQELDDPLSRLLVRGRETHVTALARARQPDLDRGS